MNSIATLAIKTGWTTDYILDKPFSWFVTVINAMNAMNTMAVSPMQNQEQSIGDDT